MNENYTSNYFNGIVGLPNTKRRLSFYINNSLKDGIMPNILFSASKGTGKTTVARMIAAALKRRLVEVNCAELNSLDDFFGIYNQYINNEKAALFMDETENLNKDIAIALLTILNPNNDNHTKYVHTGTEYRFDFHKIFFMFATTEPQTIHHALVDRLRVIDFDDYTTEDLKQIISNNLYKYKIEKGLLDRMVTIVRSNPRQAQILSNDLIAFLRQNEKSELTTEEWGEFYREMGIYNLGLTSSEIKLLKILKKFPNSSLTRVSSILNQTPESTRRATELYPLKMGLIEIKPATGRNLTADGYKYIQEIGE